ncbi:MAG: rRNA maturation RNase YbeY [Lutibacter sp.]
MIVFNYEINFKLKDEQKTLNWIESCIKSYQCRIGEINYIFCDDSYLYELNKKYLNQDTLTDIISFDYTVGKELSGDIFISVERVRENAIKFNQTFDNEINRVIIHGILHYIGFKDKSKDDAKQMRLEEENCLSKWI